MDDILDSKRDLCYNGNTVDSLAQETEAYGRLGRRSLETHLLERWHRGDYCVWFSDRHGMAVSHSIWG